MLANPICPVYKKCGGCPQYELTSSQSAQKKEQAVLAWLSEHALDIVPKIHLFDWIAFRDRCDLQYDHGKLGLYQRESSTIVNITKCPKAHSLINKAIDWLTNNPPPIPKASFRIRRAPDNTIGLWIDTSNINVSALLKERTWVTKAQENFIVEIGQRHKRLKAKENGWGLNKHPVLFPWFETPYTQEESTSLYSTIASFTQPSMKSNEVLVQTVREIVLQSSSTHWLEYGCGTGNFTFMLSQHAKQIHLIEVNPMSKKGFRRGLQDISTQADIGFIETSISTYDFQSLLVDPPRSGMDSSIHALSDHRTCTEVIYVSCNFESMKTDIALLFSFGYILKSITGIDQFPKSDHCEWVAHLVKSSL